MKCIDCPYCWQEADENGPCCHYCGPLDLAPCECKEREDVEKKLKFNDVLPYIDCVDYVIIIYDGEYHIYLFEYDTDKIKEYGEYYIKTISGGDSAGGSYGDTIYFELE